MNLQLDRLWDWQRQLQRWLLLVIFTVLVGLPLWAAPAWATVVEDIPNLSANRSTWVKDQGDLLSIATERSINKTFSQVSRQTGIEVRMVTIRGLNYSETPETFVNKLFEQWFPSPEAQAAQVLLVYDARTNVPAIALGEKASTVLPDVMTHSIAFENLLIPIRKGNYNEAFLGASQRFAAVLTGEPDPGPPAVEAVVVPESNFPTAEETNIASSAIIVIVLLVLATAVPMLTYFYFQRS
jgi:uncharacterized protein